ncbi:RNA polymerase sigma factor [Roseobacter sp.]|uniref:RNA polymerase sigma factor n=1 Tax=Roseobacter sp. TaxID=1907202 RepID=UPI00385807CD
MVEDEELSRLIGEVAHGSRLSLRTLFERTGGYLLAVCQRRLGHRDLAEEAVQDTFVAIWKSAKDFDASAGSAKAWMSTIARRRAIDRLRASPWLNREVTLEAEQKISETNADRLALSGCLSRLERTSHLAIRLCYLYGMTHQEVSLATGVPLGTIKSRIRRALLQLRKCLDQ